MEREGDIEREGERGVCVKKRGGGGVVECNGEKKVIQYIKNKNLQIYKESK